MWTQVYAPILGSIPLSALAAALPLLTLAYLLAVRHLPSHVAAPLTLGVAALVALSIYGAPPKVVLSAAAMGAAFGLFPILWIVVNALFVYNLAVHTGRFNTIRDSVAALSPDRRIQALIVAFSFGALMESIAGFGTPIALGAAMLVGLGFGAEVALPLVLLSNTTAVAFGNLGIPVISLAGVVAPLFGVQREVLERTLSTLVGRQISVLSLAIPFLLVVVLAGRRGLREVWPAALVVGVSFALTQLVVASALGPSLAGVLASLASFAALFGLLRVWRPARVWQPAYYSQVDSLAAGSVAPRAASREVEEGEELSAGVVLDAWAPFVILVAVVVFGSLPLVSPLLESVTLRIPWPALDGEVLKAPPLVRPEAAGTGTAVYPAVYVFDWLRAAGMLALVAGVVEVIRVGMPLRTAARIYARTLRGLRRTVLAVMGFLALAWVMNYAGLTATLGLFFTFTGPLFPFFSAFVGWLGVFLTGSDTASNNLFGGLQVTTAQAVGGSPLLAAATNSSGGVCGKLVSPQNLSIGAAAVERPGTEGQILRRTLPWSLGLAAAVGLLGMLQAYVFPGTVPTP